MPNELKPSENTALKQFERIGYALAHVRSQNSFKKINIQNAIEQSLVTLQKCTF